MPGTALIKDVLWRASVLLQDAAPQFVRYTEREMVAWLDDAAMALAKYMPSSCSRLDAIKLKPGTRQSIERILAADCKPGDGSEPAAPVQGTSLLSVTRNMGTNGLSPGKAIRPTSRKMLDAQNPLWHMITRGSVSEYVYDPELPRYFFVTPGVPADVAVWVEVSYTAQPLKSPPAGDVGAEVYRIEDASTSTISVSDEHVDDLVNYIVARANMKATDWADGNKANYFASLFTDSINATVTARTGTNPNLKRLPFAPEPMGAAS